MPFVKGKSGNPGGRKRDDARALLEAAIHRYERKHKVDFFDYVVLRAVKDNAVLVALLRKLVPDLKQVDANIGQLEPFRLILSNGHRSTKPAHDSDPPGEQPEH